MYKIIDSCYYFIGDIMENSLIEIINSIDTKDYKVFIERIKESLKSNNENNYYVGANNLNGAKISKTLSTRSEFLDKQEISMQSDLMDIRRQVVGNVDDAYIELMNKIKKSEFCDFEHLCYLVYETVTDYFGYNYNLEKRLQIFKTIDEVHNKIRGLSPWPTATAVLGGKKVKLHSSEKTELKGGAPGEITVSHGEMLVACKDGKLLKILELQPEGKKRMSAEAFLLGHKIQSGDSFK